MHLFAAALLALFSPSHVLGEPPAAADGKTYAGKNEMNGYKFSDYAGFEKKWKLVTVRFRKDTGEMRFTYANEIAWNALVKGEKPFPEGAVFGKVGAMTREDPAFASSAVPSGVRRYQLMVRDKKANPYNDGWGYALFDAKGLTFPEEPKLSAQACHACHRLVPERGFVFSEILELSSNNLAGVKGGPAAALEKLGERVTFETTAVRSLSPALRAELKGYDRVELVRGELRDHLFQGTLDEVKPVLSQKVLETGRPSGLVSGNGLRFSLVLPGAAKACPEGQASLVAVFTSEEPKSAPRRTAFCLPGKS